MDSGFAVISEHGQVPSPMKVASAEKLSLFLPVGVFEIQFDQIMVHGDFKDHVCSDPLGIRLHTFPFYPLVRSQVDDLHLVIDETLVPEFIDKPKFWFHSTISQPPF